LEHLQNISDDKKEFRDTLTAKGVPDAICDLLFEKYVATKKRSASDESAGDRKRRCVKQKGLKVWRYFAVNYAQGRE